MTRSPYDLEPAEGDDKSPYAQLIPSPYAEPVRRPSYLEPKRRVAIPDEPKPRRWPWLVTGAVSLVVIVIAVAMMLQNLGSQPQRRAFAHSQRPSVVVVTATRTVEGAPSMLDTAPVDGEDSDAPLADQPPDETAEITPQAPPVTVPKAKPPAPEPEDGQARIPSVRGRNAEDVRQELSELGFDNVQLVAANPADGGVLWAASWKAVSVTPTPGQIVDVTDTVTVRCAPAQS